MKTVLITGATSGFGKGLVQEFLKANYKVIATGRNLLNRQKIFAKEREQFSQQLVELNLDVTDKTQINAIESYFQNQPLDILVNNAGYGLFGPVEECTEEKLRHQFEVNFFGLVLLTQKLLPQLRKSQGHIFNFSSVFGLMGFPLSAIYCASKFAVEGFSESLSYELMPFQVKVTLVEPGGYRTNFNHSSQWGKAANTTASPYHKQIHNYERLRTKLATRPNPQDPLDVVRGVVKIAGQTTARLNYTFGKDAMFTRILRKSLPRFFFHQLTGKYINRFFSKDLH